MLHGRKQVAMGIEGACGIGQSHQLSALITERLRPPSEGLHPGISGCVFNPEIARLTFSQSRDFGMKKHA